MYQTFHGFHSPMDENQKIWRFIDFTKYVDMLDKKELYFCRLDKFEDPFEGVSPTNKLANDPIWKKIEKTRPFNYINCWHMNEYESAAMWKIYLMSNNGLAIQSTFAKLKAAFENTQEEIFISIVKYHDYNKKTEFELIKENPWSPGSQGSSIMPQIFKRISFEHERELRAIYIDKPIEYEDEKILNRNLKIGKSIKVDIDKLIEKIYIAPKADNWFKDLVTSISLKFGLNKPIEKSDLYKRQNLK